MQGRQKIRPAIHRSADGSQRLKQSHPPELDQTSRRKASHLKRNRLASSHRPTACIVHSITCACACGLQKPTCSRKQTGNLPATEHMDGAECQKIAENAAFFARTTCISPILHYSIHVDRKRVGHETHGETHRRKRHEVSHHRQSLQRQRDHHHDGRVQGNAQRVQTRSQHG